MFSLFFFFFRDDFSAIIRISLSRITRNTRYDSINIAVLVQLVVFYAFRGHTWFKRMINRNRLVLICHLNLNLRDWRAHYQCWRTHNLADRTVNECMFFFLQNCVSSTSFLGIRKSSFSQRSGTLAVTKYLFQVEVCRISQGWDELTTSDSKLHAYSWYFWKCNLGRQRTYKNSDELRCCRRSLPVILRTCVVNFVVVYHTNTDWGPMWCELSGISCAKWLHNSYWTNDGAVVGYFDSHDKVLRSSTDGREWYRFSDFQVLEV